METNLGTKSVCNLLVTKRSKQHIGEVRSKIYNSERGFYRILEFGNEIDYGVKAFQGKIGANRLHK